MVLLQNRRGILPLRKSVRRVAVIGPNANATETMLVRAPHPLWQRTHGECARATAVVCRVVSCRVVSCRVVSCRVVSCRVCVWLMTDNCWTG
jgi:beta-glucosidase-like glycosyl hydrolase